MGPVAQWYALLSILRTSWSQGFQVQVLNSSSLACLFSLGEGLNRLSPIPPLSYICTNGSCAPVCSVQNPMTGAKSHPWPGSQVTSHLSLSFVKYIVLRYIACHNILQAGASGAALAPRYPHHRPYIP
ncbi:hypothetical protein BJ508DRAFT_165170 [Ascobolus immersus RN42]|uniref:Secreted protein n=1 Tax=Ascobolus immersus RN42 TaxID=1160509 RepID=A0A3N4I7C2_ASCIM|nr:hypothetical protein BJ508DRAFT_165170 [Ascobolus immersus RN42]